MKQTIWFIIALSFFVTPVIAQDDGTDGDFDLQGLLGGEPSEGPSAVGPRVDVLADLRRWLEKSGSAPLEKKQEKPLTKVYDREVKAMAKAFEKKFAVSLESAMAAQAPARGRRGGRGAAFSRTSPEQTAEISRLSSQLSEKIIAALRIDQQAALRKYQSEQLRVRRLNALTRSMSLAGLPLTADQAKQVESLYARESYLRTLIIVEAKGQPYQGKTELLETQTIQRVVRLLNQTQRAALTVAMAKSKTPSAVTN
jgi:hypothetical protein